jgi:hypothetical protein
MILNDQWKYQKCLNKSWGHVEIRKGWACCAKKKEKKEIIKNKNNENDDDAQNQIKKQRQVIQAWH